MTYTQLMSLLTGINLIIGHIDQPAGTSQLEQESPDAFPGIVQFAFGDGSVRSVRPGNTATVFSSDWYLLQQMAGFHDGLSADTSPIQ